MVSPILQLTNISKSFGHVQANKNINLTINKGTIHGIIGENGAGKSTLMSIVYGLYQADSGTIKVNEREIKLKSPRDSIENGIGMVHQHFMLVENFTVLENIVLGFEGEVVFGKNLEKAKIDLKNLCETYNLNVDLDSVISDLSVGFRQRVEILKSLYRGAEVFILDEPTGVLTPQEVDELFKILRSLKEEGKINDDTFVISNGFKRAQYITNIARLINNGHQNCIPIIDNYEEIDLLSNEIYGNYNIGIRIASEEDPKFEFYTSRLGIGYKNIFSNI